MLRNIRVVLFAILFHLLTSLHSQSSVEARPFLLFNNQMSLPPIRLQSFRDYDLIYAVSDVGGTVCKYLSQGVSWSEFHSSWINHFSMECSSGPELI